MQWLQSVMFPTNIGTCFRGGGLVLASALGVGLPARAIVIRSGAGS